MRIHFDPLSRISVGFLLAGLAAIIFSAVEMGPEVKEVATVIWLTFALGLLAVLISLVLYTVAVFLRATSWLDAGALALVGGSLILGSLLWLRPVKDDPVIFHPAVGTELLGLLAFLIAIICMFRAAQH